MLIGCHSFPEAVENMAEWTDVNMLAGMTVDTHDTEDVSTDSEGITVDTGKHKFPLLVFNLLFLPILKWDYSIIVSF